MFVLRYFKIILIFIGFSNCLNIPLIEGEIDYYEDTTSFPPNEEFIPSQPESDLLFFATIISLAIIGILFFMIIAFCSGCAHCNCKIGINDERSSYQEI